MTPLMQQYKTIKAKYPDAILLFRVGDFYEIFDEDARIAAKILGIILTETTDNSDIKANASLPFNSVDVALQKLVKAGYRVAICDQLEDPKTAKENVKRGVTDVMQPIIKQQTLFKDF